MRRGMYESERAFKNKSTSTGTSLDSPDNNNGAIRRSQTGEVSSRYRSPSPSGSRRCPSPNVGRTSTSTVSVPKRAISVERNRPTAPLLQPSPPFPSTPVHDTTAATLLASRNAVVVSNKLPESLWPCRIRGGLSASSQSDTAYVHMSKREKTVSDQTLRPSAHRSSSGRLTPERKRIPLNGNNFADQLQNSRPVDSLHARIDQRQLPSRTSGEKSDSSVRRLSMDGTGTWTSKPLMKSPRDFLKLISRDEIGKEMLRGSSVDDDDDDPLRMQRPRSSSSSHVTSSNVVAHKSNARSLGKLTPERKMSPLKGNSFRHQLENSRPVHNLHARIDQHQLPSRIDISDKIAKTSSLFNSRTVEPSSRRRLSLDGTIDDDQLRTKRPQSSSSSDRASSRKLTLERKMSPLKRNINLGDQLEKSRLVDSLHDYIDQHQSPCRMGGDKSDKIVQTSSLFNSRTLEPASLRRLSLDGTGTSKPLSKSPSDLLKLMSRDEIGKDMLYGSSVDDDDDDDDDPLRIQRPRSSISSGRTLSNVVAHKSDTPSFGKLTPERKMSPLKRNDFSNQLDNQLEKTPSLFNSRTVAPSSLRRLSLDGTRIGTSKPLLKSPGDFLKLISRDEIGKDMLYGSSVDDSLRMQSPWSSSTGRAAQSLLAPGSRPSRARLVNPSSKGPSPARLRPSSPSRQTQSLTPALNFTADIKKGKKVANNVEDAHQLSLLYTRHLQWRYVNARTIDALHSQKAEAEKLLYSVWRIILDIRDSVTKKSSRLQQLRLKVKIYSRLDNQLIYLDKWASTETDHTDSLTCAIQDLRATTIPIPVTGGATGDITTLKEAMCTAFIVMMEVGSSLCSILPKVEETNCLVSELAALAACEKAMLDECESLLGSTAALRVEEDSLRTHLLQMKQGWRKGEPSM